MTQQRLGRLAALAACAALVMRVGVAQATILNAGDTLDIPFHFSAAPVTPFGATDTVEFDESDTNLSFTPLQAVAKFYNGTTLLAQTNFTPLVFQTITLASTASAWNFDFTAFATDFSSIVNGTIDGHLDITLLQGRDDISIGVIGAGHSTGAQSFVDASVFPTLGPATVIPANGVPEPASIAVFGTGLLGLGLLTRRRARYRPDARG